MSILLPTEIINEIIIFIGDLKLCFQIKNEYTANKVYNKDKHSYKEACIKGELEIVKFLHKKDIKVVLHLLFFGL